MTFSIVALDKETMELGIAVQSKFPAVGSLVPWLSLDAGGIATQAWVNLEYGRMGLKLLRAGAKADQTLKILLENDNMKQHRQVGILDMYGNAVSYTGSDCYPYAGSLTGDAVAVQGNILAGEEVINSMMDRYLNTNGDLAERLISALEAGQMKGGDKRGQQSANLIVYKKNAGYGGGSDVYIDVRVDDHHDATHELRRVFEIYSLTLLEREDPSAITKLDNDVYLKIGQKLNTLGLIDKSVANNIEQISAAFIQWLHTNNFENKIRDDGYIWDSILEYLFNL